MERAETAEVGGAAGPEAKGAAPGAKRIRKWQHLRASEREAPEREAARHLWCTAARLIGGKESGKLVPYELRRATGHRFSSRVALELAGWVALAAVWGHPALVGALAELAELLDCSKRSAWAAAQELERGGWVETHRRFTPYRDAASGKWRHVQRASCYTPGPLLRIAMQMAAAHVARPALDQVPGEVDIGSQLLPPVRNHNLKNPETPPPVDNLPPVDNSRNGDPERERSESPIGDQDPAPTGASRREADKDGAKAPALGRALATRQATRGPERSSERRSPEPSGLPTQATPNVLRARYASEGPPEEWLALMASFDLPAEAAIATWGAWEQSSRRVGSVAPLRRSSAKAPQCHGARAPERVESPPCR